LGDQLSRLRAELEKAQADLIEAEARLADELAAINAFEFEFEARVGHLWDKLDALETEIEGYKDRIQMMRKGYLSVERQYQRAWQAPSSSAPTPPPQPPSPASEAQIKSLYRQLARRFHPDLATDDADRAYRTEKMAAVNDAYAARSLAELDALAKEPDVGILSGRAQPGQTEASLIEALQRQLDRCQHRLNQIETQMRSLHQRPSVQFSLEVKVARGQGRDLLGEMVADLENKIARKSAERDMLKAQFDQLGPDQGIIQIR
jgi:predicted RNase H-like nuclease (RuvC/YqgF family)